MIPNGHACRRRRSKKEKRGHDTKRECEQHDLSIKGKRRRGQVPRDQDRLESEAPCCQQNTQKHSGNKQDRIFREELPKELRSPRTDSDLDSRYSRYRPGTSQKKIDRNLDRYRSKERRP